MRKVIDSFKLTETKAGNYRGYGKNFQKANASKTPSNQGFEKARLVKKPKTQSTFVGTTQYFND